MIRARTVLLMTALVALAMGAGSAEAHKRKIQRHTTVEFQDLPGSTGDRIFGQLAIGPQPQEPLYGSGLAMASGIAGKCLAGQKVLIRHNYTAEGGGSDQPDVVATATTDATGAWETTSYEASGGNQLLFDSFHVEVSKTRLPPKNARHKHVCLGAFADRTVFSY
jgi:hypothetical protein